MNQALFAPPAANSAGMEWDYKVASIHTRHNDGLEEQLKEHGRDGWELVCVNLPMANEYQCIFRKAILRDA